MEIFGSIVIPAIVAGIAAFATVATGAFGYWSRNREQDIEMVRIALSILGGENKDTSLPGRKFALRTLQKHTGVGIPSEEFNEWAEKGTLPKSIAVWTTLGLGMSGQTILREAKTGRMVKATEIKEDGEH